MKCSVISLKWIQLCLKNRYDSKDEFIAHDGAGCVDNDELVQASWWSQRVCTF